MDYEKIGKLIAMLRREKDLTQENIANALGISNKTVSKWECGLGVPDISLWQDLSIILGVDVDSLMVGELPINKKDSGNINRIKFYVCDKCNNILFSTGEASIHCCGKKLSQKHSEWDMSKDLKLSEVDGNYYVELNHSMTKQDYILFFAYVKNDKVILERKYPEGECTTTLPMIKNAKLFAYSTTKGLSKEINLSKYE